MNREFGRITILLAHPNIAESRANKELLEAVRELDYVMVYNLFDEQHQQMDVDTWSNIIFESSVLVFQFPLYWMSAPYMLKRWLDEVFISLSRTPVVMGKCLQLVVTTGSECEAYRSGGRNRFTMDEILRPYQGCAIHAGMRWETPLVVFGTGAEETGRIITEGAIQYKQKLEELALNNRVQNGYEW